MDIQTFPKIINVTTNFTTIAVTQTKKEVTVNSGGTYNFNFTGSLNREILTINNNNQTIFLINTVNIVENAQLYLNGVKQIYGIDYVIDNAITTLSWLGINLEITDYLEIYY